MSKYLYIFDMDETLVDGDCSMLWNQYLVDEGYVDIPNFLDIDKELMARYARGEMDMEEYLDFVMQPLSDIPTESVDTMLYDFVERYVSPRVYEEAKTLIHSLKNTSNDMLIISATASFIVSKVAKSLGIAQSLGIDMVVDNNRYTSKVDGVPSYREGKITRLEMWLQQKSDEYEGLHFFTDSINDLPLCNYADRVYLVNPCEKLKQAAQGKNWQTYAWSKTALSCAK
ncbi:HAD family hydrolase [Vibrio ziniensis]|uniref:HAD family hydrolase n=1 Tax=Vibrio ziniensis TaxID=2711221 RepID=A0A6G7CHW8_9VIBR|nr:HAD family hydrolase [Vibrio ziniensis]QIH41653.1 HAD family hydrolase [Vibrio ziniensis]